MWNYRRINKLALTALAGIVLVGSCLLGENKTVSAKEIYVCSTEEELSRAITYSNQHKETWVSIKIPRMIEISKGYEIEGKVRMFALEDSHGKIRRKGFEVSMFSITGRLQLGSASEETWIEIDGGARQGERGNAAVEVKNGGKLEMLQGCRIQYNYNKSEDKEVFPRGGGVLVKSGGTFIMNEGQIHDCWSKNTKILDVREKNAAVGGGVAVESEDESHYGTFLMYGGRIYHCASQQGGGIFSCGKFLMDGGEICENYANVKSHGSEGCRVSYEECAYNTGGGIKLQGYLDESSPRLYARTEITGGNICHNEAYNGGGIRITNGARLKITGGDIFQNQAANRGGGLDIGNGKYEKRAVTEVQITDGSISGCQAKRGGACAVSHGKCHLLGLQAGANKAREDGSGIYLSADGKLYLQGTTYLAEDDDIYLMKDAWIRLSGELSADGRVATVSMAESQYQAGRKVAEVIYDASGSVGLYGDTRTWSGEHLVLKDNTKGCSLLRPGDYLKASRVKKEQEISLAKADIFISESYPVRYKRNREEEVRELPEDSVKYWYEDYRIPKKIPVADTGKFSSWNTKSSGGGKRYSAESLYEDNQSLTLYGIWDYGMKIVVKDTAVFYENQIVGKKELTGSILRLEDQEDGTIKDAESIDRCVSVCKISYQKAENGYQPVDQVFPKGMQEEKMDTYFMNLKEEERVGVTVLFTAQDQAGNVTEKEALIKVCYNHPPDIQVSDYSYYDFEIADQWEKVKKELEENGEVTDQEDQILWKRNPQISIKKPESLHQDDFRIPAMYKIIYEAKDSLGKISQAQAVVYVADSNPYGDGMQGCVRFISQKYLSTLKNNSPWKTNPEQYQLLQKSLTSTKKDAKKTITIP